MSPMFITAIAGFALTVLALGQVTPSAIEMINAKKFEIGVNREEALMQQIVRFKTITGAYPANIAALVSAGYWRAADNDNGFGSSYSFSIDQTKGVVTVTSAISDATKRAQYINNFRHKLKPTDVGGNNVAKTFIFPNSGSLASPVPVPGSIPVASVAPAAATNTWWYDTSGTVAVLKVSDGSSWRNANSTQSTAPTTDNIVTTLPASGVSGDIKYLYNSTNQTLTSYVRYNSQWVVF